MDPGKDVLEQRLSRPGKTLVTWLLGEDFQGRGIRGKRRRDRIGESVNGRRVVHQRSGGPSRWRQIASWAVARTGSNREQMYCADPGATGHSGYSSSAFDHRLALSTRWVRSVGT